ncbi:hypothetical protein F5Y00DRAFT_241405 [Daldinia vernicosa]|uniref:uncharacterized protein n=1 Tax=Daldinia vernicosa TaxID=114800 RepID=UPI0020074E63|nr:uncharacterized protein F5Y00DRAFT_241405 [Daldinia vernicosa]KAI0847418.1 hypothetical protein F5Y00DRAFT_241405 [Daldinia vernicosa]
MGLPLWVEPDESGSRAKTAPKSSADPATGRSPIRRSTSPRRAARARTDDRIARRNRAREYRAQRLGILMSQQDNSAEDELNLHFSGPVAIPESVSNPFRVVAAPQELRAPDSEIPTNVANFLRSSRSGRLVYAPHLTRGGDASQEEDDDNDELPVLEEDDAPNSSRFGNTQSTRNLRSNGGDNDTSPTDSDDWRHSPRREYRFRTRSRRISPTTRLRQVIDHYGHLREEHREIESTRDRAPANLANVLDPPGSSMDQHIHTALQEMSDRRRRSGADRRRAHRVRYVDGLGDRDRSLSPEGDGVWSVLQSTLTVDPHPPSVGSSFASTTASTIASLNPTVPSSRTSITSPTEEIEPPCDPVGEPETTTEGSGSDVQGTDRSRQPTPHGRRSYAAVAADTISGIGISSDDPEWLSGMHRIVSGLASRQDIPDEWWEQAGLSRSMSLGWPL